MGSPTEQQIRQHAYRLWEAAGKPEDREQEFWHQAERELNAASGEASGASNPDEKSATFLE